MLFKKLKKYQYRFYWECTGYLAARYRYGKPDNLPDILLSIRPDIRPNMRCVLIKARNFLLLEKAKVQMFITRNKI